MFMCRSCETQLPEDARYESGNWCKRCVHVMVTGQIREMADPRQAKQIIVPGDGVREVGGHRQRVSV